MAIVNEAPGKWVTDFKAHPKFFNRFAKNLGALRERQVSGALFIINEWRQTPLTDLRWLAYMFASAWHETQYTLQPVTEYGSLKYLKSKPYWPYIGRGLIQLTHKENYQKYGIADKPLRALEPKLAAHIMLDGMSKGIYTGKKLGDYFNAKKTDGLNARRIVNGMDCAAMIEGHYKKFLDALKQEPATTYNEPITVSLT